MGHSKQCKVVSQNIMLCPFHTWLDVIISWLLISDHPRANNKCFPRFSSHIVPTPMQGPHSMSSGSLTEHAWGQGKESAKGMSNQTSCEWYHSDLWMGIICFLSEKLGGIFNLRASWSQSQFCFPQIFFFNQSYPPPKEIEFLNCLCGCWLLVWFPFGLGGTKYHTLTQALFSASASSHLPCPLVAAL